MICPKCNDEMIMSVTKKKMVCVNIGCGFEEGDEL